MNQNALTLFIFFLMASNIYAQDDVEAEKKEYFSMQTGADLTLKENVEAGIRAFFEYQKDFKGNWQYGISYEYGYFHNDPRRNLAFLAFNWYYKLHLVRDKIVIV